MDELLRLLPAPTDADDHDEVLAKIADGMGLPRALVGLLTRKQKRAVSVAARRATWDPRLN